MIVTMATTTKRGSGLWEDETGGRDPVPGDLPSGQFRPSGIRPSIAPSL